MAAEAEPARGSYKNCHHQKGPFGRDQQFARNMELALFRTVQNLCYLNLPSRAYAKSLLEAIDILVIEL